MIDNNDEIFKKLKAGGEREDLESLIKEEVGNMSNTAYKVKVVEGLLKEGIISVEEARDFIGIEKDCFCELCDKLEKYK